MNIKGGQGLEQNHRLKLTPEQDAVVQHESGHARVLAVAGSGKTSTMVYRLEYLLRKQGADARKIRVLMFNKWARVQFETNLQKVGISPSELKPFTFHSYALGILSALNHKGRLPEKMKIIGDESTELSRRLAHKAIRELEKEKIIPEKEVDIDDVVQSISLWKGALIPSDRAGHRTNSHLPLVYARYETIRKREKLLFYDDYVFTVVQLLLENEAIRRTLPVLKHVLIDEYQDVNLGQQKLIELIAGDEAELMVVGDDDQTIYEWRGARPNYIIRDFQTAFQNMPHALYKLTKTFRFGPLAAQVALNVISFNSNRQEKNLLASDPTSETQILVYGDHSTQGGESNRQLAEEIVRHVKIDQVPPKEIWVLARTYAQLSGMEVQFLRLGIPYRILDREPFFKRREVQVLLDYLRLAHRWLEPMNQLSEKWLFNTANTPNRRLTETILSRVCRKGREIELSPKQILRGLIDQEDSVLYQSQRESAEEFFGALQKAHEMAFGVGETDSKATNEPPRALAGDVLRMVVEMTEYEHHFDNYYGIGEESSERKELIRQFIEFVRDLKLQTDAFLKYIDGLDTTRGMPEDQQITCTTVFKTKGLEFDYVFIPDCIEGTMPCLYPTDPQIYDRDGISREPEPSLAIENERRLFYVAITRARKAVYIGTIAPPPSSAGREPGVPIPSRFLEEMLLAETSDLLGPIARLESLTKKDRWVWLEHINKLAGHKRIMSNLHVYLVRLKDVHIAPRVARLVAEAPEAPFRYRNTYGDRVPKLRNSERDMPSKNGLTWDDLDIPF